MNRCGNCGKYPFCSEIVSAGSVCDEWISEENKWKK